MQKKYLLSMSVIAVALCMTACTDTNSAQVSAPQTTPAAIMAEDENIPGFDDIYEENHEFETDIFAEPFNDDGDAPDFNGRPDDFGEHDERYPGQKPSDDDDGIKKGEENGHKPPQPESMPDFDPDNMPSFDPDNMPSFDPDSMPERPSEGEMPFGDNGFLMRPDMGNRPAGDMGQQGMPGNGPQNRPQARSGEDADSEE